ncbi:MAG: polyhydroxybutyrate depolymerase [Methylococcaceae bacterium NSP1-1]|nr:MAG: polyhydroxybutyrate depolymerase [Methylococcaceae bacterium NSP1-1]
MFKTYFGKLKAASTLRNSFFILLFLLPILITLTLFFGEDNDEFSQMGNASYSGDKIHDRCDAGTRPGESGAFNGESTGEGIKYNVRMPLNYDSTIAHPLLMVYSPAKSNRAKTEKMTGLTLKATTAGFIVAYAEHSDGGTAAMALAFMAGTKHIPDAIAPSAAGIDYQDLRDRKCPKPIPVMIMHSANDHLFPKYGVQSSGWWAACNKCEPIPEKIKNGCMAYSGCANGIKTWYCEGDKLHAQWPGINDTLVDFFVSVGR